MFLLLEYINLNPFDVCFCQFMLIKQATYVYEGQNYETHVDIKEWALLMYDSVKRLFL